MLIRLSEKEMLLRDTIREFTEKEVAPRDRWMDENGFDEELVRKAGEIGITGINIPVEFGGAGGDAYVYNIICHELAKGSASLALSLDINWVANDMILKYGTEEQKKKYLPDAANGSLFAFCLTEPGAGSDAAGIKTKANKVADGWIVNGSKAWITNAGVAKYYIVMAQTGMRGSKKEISAFIVHEDDAGFSVGKHENKMGMRGSQTAELYFDNLFLPDSRLLASRGAGLRLALEALDGGRVSVAAIAVGLSQHAMQLAKEYANERTAFGQKIANLQAIQAKFADMSTEIRAAELLTYDAAMMKAHKLNHTLEGAQAKLFASSRCTQICLECLQIFGGNGYSREYDIERLVRDAKLLEIGEGTNEILRNVIGKKVLAAK